MFVSRPDWRACFFTICQIRAVVGFVPRSDKKISLLLRRFTNLGRSVDKYDARASHAFRPTGTILVLLPLPVTRKIPSSVTKFSRRAFDSSDMRRPLA